MRLRRKLRTFVTALGVAIAVAALFSLLAFQRGYQAGMQGELDRLGAHVLVVPKGCPYDAASIALHGASWPCYLKEAYLAQVTDDGRRATAAPLLMNALYDETGGQSVYLGAEPGLLAVKRGWHIAGQFSRTGAGLPGRGERGAESCILQIGQTFALPGLKKRNGAKRDGTCGGHFAADAGRGRYLHLYAAC